MAATVRKSQIEIIAEIARECRIWVNWCAAEKGDPDAVMELKRSSSAAYRKRAQQKTRRNFGPVLISVNQR
jgi:hypothetical protein